MNMKLWLIGITCLVQLPVLRAATVYTTVFNVFTSVKTEKVFVLSGIDGRIYKTHKSDVNFGKIHSMIGQVVRLDYSINGQEAIIDGIELARPDEVDPRTMDLNRFQYDQLRQFAPSDLGSFQKAEEVFSKMLNDGDKSRSQCFKRAHMWSYDMWSKLGINSEKIFIFYTKRFNILEKLDWWFHVAPMVTVGGVEYVMDGTFMEKPVTVKAWMNHFTKTDKITCPVIENYQDFENGHWKRLCYLMKVPMYFLSPLDIENRDKSGLERNHWVIDELQDARRAFKNWEKVYEGLDTGKQTKRY